MTVTQRLLAIYVGLYLLFLYAPVLMLPLFSVDASPAMGFPIRALTVHWYALLAQDPAVRAALVASLGVAAVASVVATLAGLLGAYALVRRQGIAARPVAAMAVAPLLIPGVVLGVAILITARLLGLAPSLPVVAFGHVVICLPLCLIVLRSHFLSTGRAVEDAARDLGASPAMVMLRVVLPMAAPSLVSCLLLSFTTSMDEFVVSFFLAGRQQTLPIFIWNHLRFPLELPRMMALGTLLLAVSTLLALLAERVSVRAAPGTVLRA